MDGAVPVGVVEAGAEVVGAPVGGPVGADDPEAAGTAEGTAACTPVAGSVGRPHLPPAADRRGP